MARKKPLNLSNCWTPVAASFFIFFWASGFISAKYGLPYAEPFTFLALRFLLALTVLVPFLFFCKIEWPKSKKSYFHVIFAGLLIQSTYLTGVFYGIFIGVSTGVMALIVGLQPLVTGALAAPTLGEKIRLSQWFGLALGFIGLGLVVVEKVDFTHQSVIGLLFALGALSGITIGTLYQKRYCSQVDIRVALCTQNTTSFFVLGMLAIVFETLKVHWTLNFFYALTWSGIGLSIFGIGIYFFLVKRGAAAKVTSLMYLSPPTTAFMGWLMFDETFTLLALTGLFIAVAGVALANK